MSSFPSSFISSSCSNSIREHHSKARSLPPLCYSDQEFYNLEVNKIFKKNWITVGRVEDVPNLGDYFSLELFGDPLLVVRGEDNIIRTISRVCTHRWMEIVQDKGNTKNFRCPYHGWIFDLEGKLRAAPHMPENEFQKHNCNLPKLLTEIWQGFIFVNYDPEAKPVNEKLLNLEHKLQNYQISDMRAIEPIVYESNWNWKVMVENASEVYHLPLLHQPTLLSNLPLRNSIIEDCKGPYTYYRIPNENRKPLETSFTPPSSLNEEQLSEFVLCTVFPFHIMIINPDQMTWIQILPTSPTTHTLKFHLCFHSSAFRNSHFKQKCKLGKWFLKNIHEEDIFACGKVQKGLQSSLSRPAHFSYLEKSLWQFHNWILDQL